MNYSSYNEVLDYLKSFFSSRVKSLAYREELDKLIEGSRSNKTVTIRAIYQLYMKYIAENRGDVKEIPGEKELWINL
ncbi:hypothetical protein ACMSZN_004563, partial [Cronobacter dublinensis]